MKKLCLKKQSASALSGTFEPDACDTWKPWKYEHRVKVANDVDKLKTKIGKEYQQNVLRSPLLFLNSRAGKSLNH